MTIKLEGQILEPWVETIREACLHESGTTRVSLDLAAVTFVDRTGVQLLRELMSGGVGITTCSSFVTDLIFPEKSE